MKEINYNHKCNERYCEPQSTSGGMTYLKTRIMRRVYFIWMLRRALSPRSLKFMIVLTSLWQIADRVYVRAVIDNSPGLADISSSVNFFLYALTHTQLMVQLSIFAFAVFILWLVVDVQRKSLNYWF